MRPASKPTRQVQIAAALVLAGIILSGPVAVAVVEIFAPQPAWHDVSTFSNHYSWLQSLPYLFGFLIAGGFVVLVGSVPVSRDDLQGYRRAASSFTAVAAGLIYFNYVLQVAFIPLALEDHPAIVAATTMANPASLGWALEMYGYAVLGIATALLAPLFTESARQRLIGRLMLLNCAVSVLGAVLVPIFPGWVLTSFGMVLGAGWNILVAFIMILILREFRFRHA
ncbi:hypothetical protein EG829_27540 [bacterium]|nr:hypothetical protein [bacterium]